MVVAERTVPREQPRYEIEPRLQEKLMEHPGKWVAMTRDELLFVSESPTEAYEEAVKMGVDTPIMYRVPDSHERAYYY